ncbi:hypothetical protein [Streptomyces sp. NPDC051704]|uniref:hypothetical protein n=1 Tax=Streptomyces sp. NPDC051704 TaxID=3365671 RepID=UPI0037B793DA
MLMHGMPRAPSSTVSVSRAAATEAADGHHALRRSELVTNAVRQGGGTCTLRLTAHAESIEVAVGWRMANRSAPATAVTRQASGGKTVSALLDR